MVSLELVEGWWLGSPLTLVVLGTDSSASVGMIAGGGFVVVIAGVGCLEKEGGDWFCHPDQRGGIFTVGFQCLRDQAVFGNGKSPLSLLILVKDPSASLGMTEGGSYYFHSKLQSTMDGLTAQIRSSFFFRRQFLSCFSRRIASLTYW